MRKIASARNIIVFRRKIRYRHAQGVSTVFSVDTTSILVGFLVLAASVLGVGMLLPQCVRLSRHQNLDGVSAGWIGSGGAVNAAWLAYAMLQGLPALLPVSVGALALYCWMLIQLRESPTRTTRALRIATACVAGFAAVTLLWGVAALGVALGFAYTAQFAPAAWESSRQQNLEGASPATWVMAFIEAAIWMLYGLTIAETSLIIGGFGASAAALIILSNLRNTPVKRPSRRGRRRRSGPHVGPEQAVP